jgi:hypothetical protein
MVWWEKEKEKEKEQEREEDIEEIRPNEKKIHSKSVEKSFKRAKNELSKLGFDLGSNAVYLQTEYKNDDMEEFEKEDFFNHGVAELALKEDMANGNPQACLLEILDTGLFFFFNFPSNLLFSHLHLAGQEEYTALRDSFIQTSQAFIIVYSVTSRKSFNQVQMIQEHICRMKKSLDVPIVSSGIMGRNG